MSRTYFTLLGAVVAHRVCPTPALPLHRLFRKEVFGVYQLARGSADLKLPAINNGDSRRVVSMIFARLEAARDDGNRAARSDISKNFTHEVRIAERTKSR
jgi:hypothetical protein